VSHPAVPFEPFTVDFDALTARERDALVVGFSHQVGVLARVLGGLHDDLEHFGARLHDDLEHFGARVDDYRAKLDALGDTAAKLATDDAAGGL
jgi:hypothetical protein